MPFTHGHAIIIGIGSYQHEPRLHVPITAADARAVAAVLRDPQACGYPADQVTLLHDSSATRDGILAALDALAQRTKPDDTVFLFYSGHGDLDKNGTYHLTTHDTRLEGTAVVAGTGISQGELLDKLRAVKAGRLLLFFNACFSGNVAPTLSTDEQPPTLGTMLPEQTATAILGTGSGRAIVTAARENQYSFIGTGTLTIFAQTLVDGLRGTGVPNRDGAITLFDLYTRLYDTVGQQTAPLVPTLPQPMREKHQGDRQQPELTLLKNLGVMTVALHPGTTAPTPLSAGGQLRDDLPCREVDEQTSQRALQQLISGPGAIGVGGDANAPITTGSGNTVTTTGNISGNSGQVAVGSNIAQASGGGSANVDSSRSVFDQRGQKIGGSQYNAVRDMTIGRERQEPRRPNLNDRRLAQVVQTALERYGLDDVLFNLGSHTDLAVNTDTLGADAAAQARNFVSLCRSNKQRTALVASLCDFEDALLGTPEEEEAWLAWARELDSK
jgi:hypothetical protein